ncbi:hypothetical protein BGC07_02475 [Piscirickettsia litoralis]|uniref:Uncharacterized protein n=1 Tax=Piscirickettsia litoralis TaxID=1891921 RepID=A0ABX2ZZU4_9GAMM|nr:hypothetical protein BGC07_02475 [Piscirickettsia litoralis]
MSQLNATDIRDLEVMLNMLESVYRCEIPAAQRILQKIRQLTFKPPYCSNRIMFCKEYPIRTNLKFEFRVKRSRYF